jgi:hypothetical protein
MDSNTPKSARFLSISGKRIVITDATADRLLDAKERPGADPWAARIYAVLTVAAHRDDARRERSCR